MLLKSSVRMLGIYDALKTTSNYLLFELKTLNAKLGLSHSLSLSAHILDQMSAHWQASNGSVYIATENNETYKRPKMVGKSHGYKNAKLDDIQAIIEL